MNTEDKINRLERTLGTLIAWSATELGTPNVTLLLDMLNADPDCLEGPSRTEEEIAAERRELNQVAPTPADKFALMFRAGGTPDTESRDSLDEDHPLWCVNVQIQEMLQGFGVTEDHDSVVRFLKSTGLPDGTVDRIHGALVCAEVKEHRESEITRLVAAFEKEVNEGFNRKADSEKQYGKKAVSDVHYIFRLHKELRERVEKVIGHWRDTDWFREGADGSYIMPPVNPQEAIKLLKYLKP